MKITRTYPQPDSPRPHIGPRERAMAVYKYLAGVEPEAAIAHPLFAVVAHAFEQAERAGWNAATRALDTHEPVPKEMQPSLCEELSSSFEAVARPLPQAEGFAPDGL